MKNNIKRKSCILTMLVLMNAVVIVAQDIKSGSNKSSIKNLAPTPPMGWNSWNWFGKKEVN